MPCLTIVYPKVRCVFEKEALSSAVIFDIFVQSLTFVKVLTSFCVNSFLFFNKF